MADFSGKRVLVTGGARGIGAAACSAFRASGARVAVGARGQESYELFLGSAEGGGFVPAIGDVVGQAAAGALVREAIARLGGLDVLVNSAGVFEEVAVEQATEAHWDRMIDVNLGGTFFCCQAALPALEASGGSIVNVASDAGLVGYPRGAAYSAAKGGVVNLTRALAVELAGRVRVNCVCPGNVDTLMIGEAAAASGDPDAYLAKARLRSPLKRMARPEEVAVAILFLASTEASFTTGAALTVDGGGLAGF
ncbi:MAG TPA: SDR family NAD(P)-dependent oxidoreductase [Stellaceae bacterium]|nr:SDR family NAD(P)-dependent oxidoreductase [Stellaceae bacterium]